MQKNICVLIDRAVIFKADYTVSLLDDIGYLGGKLAVAENQLCADFCPFAGFYERFPNVGSSLTEQKQLDRGFLASFRVTVESCGYHARVVYDQSIGRKQIICNIMKMPVLDLSAFAVDNHKARGVSYLCGMLGYQLLGQVIVKIMC